MNKLRTLFAAIILLSVFSTSNVVAEDRTALDNDIHAAIKHLLDTTPAARELAKTAHGALVFPSISKAGFIAGMQYGQGALIRKKAGGGYYITNYYSIMSASFGYQVGVQQFGYVMALMTPEAVERVENSANFELGLAPSLVIVDAAIASNLTTQTAKDDIYVFSFDMKGLMGGSGIQGN